MVPISQTRVEPGSVPSRVSFNPDNGQLRGHYASSLGQLEDVRLGGVNAIKG